MVFVPVDVVKERLQVQRSSGVAGPEVINGKIGGGGVGEASMRPYRGSADTLKTILRTEGVRGIYKVRTLVRTGCPWMYRGLGARFRGDVRDVPAAALM